MYGGMNNLKMKASGGGQLPFYVDNVNSWRLQNKRNGLHLTIQSNNNDFEANPSQIIWGVDVGMGG